MQTEAFFYCMLSISGLAGALFMYWNIMLEYHRSRLKPLTAKIVISLFLLGIGLGIFNHFLSLTLRNVTDEVNGRLGMVHLPAV